MDCRLTINGNVIYNIHTNNLRIISNSKSLKEEFSHNYRRKKIENFDDLKFNIQSIKNSTELFIQEAIENNKYLIEYEKRKIKENKDDDEENL